MKRFKVITVYSLFLGILGSESYAQTSGMSGIVPNPLGAGILGTNNTSFGARAGSGLTGNTNDNTFIGYFSGISNSVGNFNTFLGSECGHNNVKGHYNVYSGFEAGYTGIANSQNVISGYQAGYSIGGSSYQFGGDNHVFIGFKAGFNSGSGDIEGVCASNTFVGSESGILNSIGGNNAFLGARSGLNNDIGFHNTFIGAISGTTNIKGAKNTALGYQADFVSANLNNASAIGAEAKVAGNNEMILGNNDVSVGVGMSGVNILNAKLEVFNDLTINTAQRAAGYFHTDGTTGANETHGIYVRNTSSNSNRAIGAKIMNFNTCNASYGIMTQGTGGANYNIGITASTLTGSTSSINYGVVGVANTFPGILLPGGIENYGGYFISSGTGSGTNYGVFAEASNAANNWAVWSNGNQFSVTNNFWSTSDAQFKNSIKPLENALDRINKLSPKSYLYNVENPYGFNFPKGQQMGLIAQELELVFPELVMKTHKPEVKDSLGKVITSGVEFKAVNYNSLIPVLIKGIQEQSAIISELKQEKISQDSINRDLQNQIEMLVKQMNIEKNSDRIEIDQNKNSDATMVVLENPIENVQLVQNQPNPFTERTIIRFILPEIYNSAIIEFYDKNGKLIKGVELSSHGQGEITVYAQNISSGVYTYSLIVDNIIIDTKRMVKN